MAKLHIIGDELIITGFELAGVKNSYIASRENAEETLNKVLSKSDEGDVIAIAHNLFPVVEKKVKKSERIIVEIPDRTGAGEDKTREMIRNAVGMDISNL